MVGPLGASTIFTLTCDGASGAADGSATVTVAGSSVAVTGTVRYERIPHTLSAGGGLDFDATRAEPCIGVTVEITDASTGATLASGTTDALGGYSLLVPPNTLVRLRAVAEIVRDASAPLPRYSFVVRNPSNDSVYTAQSASFDSASGARQSLLITSGWNAATRQPTSTRLAAPFAILEQIRRGRDFVLAGAPTTDFGQLDIEWSTTQGATGFVASSNTLRVSGILEDTDEYDPHVVLHEFGHFLQTKFSRDQTPGGGHEAGARLDVRLAFSEGLATAFAAIVLNDPVYRDVANTTQDIETVFSVEDEFVTTRGWFSEESVMQIVYDLFDATNEPADTVTLGFAPIWSALVGDVRNGDAAASIFALAASLRANNPSAAAGIASLLDLQSIVGSTVNAFATTETNSGGSSAALPVHTPVVLGGATVSLAVSAQFGVDSPFEPFPASNRLGNRRLVTVDVPSARSITIVASGPFGSDPDVQIYSRGVRLRNCNGIGASETCTQFVQAGTVLVEVYDYELLFGSNVLSVSAR